MKILTCKNCTNQYEVKDSKSLKSKFCSRYCLFQYQKGKNHPAYKDKTTICPSCDKTFEKKKKKIKFCSVKCAKQYRTRTKIIQTINCKQCGLLTTKKTRTSKFCSNECRLLSIKKPTKVFSFDNFKVVNEMQFMLPSEAQEKIFSSNLGHKYYSTDFKKYSIKDFGFNKLSNMLRYDSDFYLSLFRKKQTTYARGDSLDRFLLKLKKSRFVFYSEAEVVQWIYENKK